MGIDFAYSGKLPLASVLFFTCNIICSFGHLFKMASTGVIGSSKLSTLIAFLKATLELDMSPEASTIPGESINLTYLDKIQCTISE